MNLTTKMKAGAAAVAGSAVVASGASALTSTFTVAIEFFDPFTIVETTPADFGRLISGVATTYVMDTTGTITPGPGGSSTGGAPAAGAYTIADSAGTAAVDVVVDNPVANGGVSITAFDCDWNGGATTDASATCTINAAANPGAGGQVLLVGFTINVDGTQASLDLANPSFDVSVNYD